MYGTSKRCTSFFSYILYEFYMKLKTGFVTFGTTWNDGWKEIKEYS